MKFHRIAMKMIPAFGLAIVVMTGGAAAGLAQGQMHMGGMANMTREEQAAHHEKMAGMHTTMAGCLKSTKTVDECHKEMQKSCETLHGGKCPAFDRGRSPFRNDWIAGSRRSCGGPRRTRACTVAGSGRANHWWGSQTH